MDKPLAASNPAGTSVIASPGGPIPTQPASPLDPFFDACDAREYFEVGVDAPAEHAFAVAAGFDLQSVAVVSAIFRLREFLLRSHTTDRTPSQGFIVDMKSLGWGSLVERPGRLFIGGAHCQPWLADVHFTPLTQETFRSFNEADRVKIAWTLETVPMTATSCRLRTETRAEATDAASRRRFLAYWRWARYGILPIRWLMLPAIRRRAEATFG